jgi:hypothetical protein
LLDADTMSDELMRKEELVERSHRCREGRDQPSQVMLVGGERGWYSRLL